MRYFDNSPFKLNKIKDLFINSDTRNTNNSDEYLSVVRDVGVIKYSERGDSGNKTSDSPEKYKMVDVGDLVINPMNVTIGSVGVSEYSGCLSGVYLVLKPKTSVNSKYYHYLFHDKGFQKYLKTISYGIMEIRESINKTEFFQFKIPKPPVDEQEEIVSYLDKKTNQINRLIKKIEQKKELLKEQRTSLINEVVTKGLNPNVEMKDSDVEWIGEIPKHYVSVKLRWIIDSIKDGTHGTHPSSDDGKILLSGKNVQDGFLNINDSERRIPLEEHEKIIKNGYPKEGDVLVSSVGSIGRSCVFEYPEPISFQRSVCFIRPSFKLNSYYLSYLIRSNVCQNQITTLINQSTVGGIYMGDLTNLSVITPPREEQEQIVEYLDEHTKKVDKTILIEEKRIKLLKEYKQSLISEVVTGKKRVVT